jgi:hypothetical protein
LPASCDNYLTVYAITRSGDVARTYYDKPGHTYNNYTQGAALADLPMLAGFDEDMTVAVRSGSEVEVDPGRAMLSIIA